MDPAQEQAASQDQAPAKQDESAIIDQIGTLIQQLSPDKQKQVIQMLEQMLGGDEPESNDVVDPMAGPNGVPAEPR